MAERNARENTQSGKEKARALPHKIELRLAALVQLAEFDNNDVTHCRRTYWSARDDWHKILVDCYEAALQRQQQPAQLETA